VLDLVIKGGTVVDGSGAAPVQANVGVRDGRIAFVDPDGGEHLDAKRTVEAQGLVVTPGFIDIHTHYDAQLFWDPACTPSSLHGITTIFCGNCGFSIAPLGADPTYIMQMLSKVEGIPLESLEQGVSWDWRSFGDYLDRVEAAGTAVNVGVMVGHSALRRLVLGDRAHEQEVAPEEVAAMRTLVAESLAMGAAGFSSSWGQNHFDGQGNPVPSRSSGVDELVALSGTLRGYPDAQLEFIPTSDWFEDLHLDVMTRMALAADAPLNWNILVPREKEWVENRLSASEHARSRGATVLALSYPDVMPIRYSFMAAGFHTTAGLDSIPGWGPILALGHEQRLAALADPATRAVLRQGADSPEGRARRLEAMTVSETYAAANSSYRGRRIGDIASESGRNPIEVLLDIVAADDLRTLLMPEPRAADDDAWKARQASWEDPRVIIGASDGGAHVDVLATFDYTVKFLARQRELQVLSLAEAVRKLTDIPARLYGVTHRGRVEPGYWADVVIFDPATVGPGEIEWREDLPARAGRLYSEPQGIHSVVVEGVTIVEDGRPTGATPGRVLRRDPLNPE
jgi:N-acyl-D-aspartate/D-glutamate deacylase